MLEEVMCQRVGAPPLRFRGALLSHAEVEGAGAARLFLSLWSRQTKRKRDLVVALSDRQSAWRAHAMVAADVDAAIGLVERRCETPCQTASMGRTAPDDPTRHDLVLAIETRCREALELQRFRQLAALALDDWYTLLERGDDLIETDTKKGT